MTRELLDLGAEHLAACAGLLARRQSRLRERDSRLPARYESPAVALSMLESLLSRGSGVVAVEDGELIGYILGAPDLDWGGRAFLVPLEGHAVEDSGATEVYREMYAAAAPSWNDNGFFQHTINIHADDSAAREAAVSLGFGQMLAFGLRDTAPVPGGRGVRVERALPEQLEDVRRLMAGLGRYNSTSPLFRPFVPQTDTEWVRAPLVLKQLADEACSYWLAYEGEKPVGIAIFTPPEPVELMVTPDDGVYLWIAYVEPDARIAGAGKALVDAGLAWARSRGHGHCTVGWFTANLVGARFWRARGYEPVMYRFERRIDERIAWATAKG